jgi:hypothetical protein
VQKIAAYPDARLPQPFTAIVTRSRSGSLVYAVYRLVDDELRRCTVTLSRSDQLPPSRSRASLP